MIKAIIFDCWGTLFTNSLSPHPFTIFAKEVGYNLSDRDFVKAFELHLMSNQNTLHENITSLLTDLSIKVSDAKVSQLEDIITRSLPTQIAYPDTVEVLERLNKKYQLVLLSNSFQEGIDSLRSKFDLKQWFSLQVISCEHGTIKPNPKLYDIIKNHTKHSTDQMIMVGDNYYDDVLAAQEYGIRSILIDKKGRYRSLNAEKISSLLELEQSLA